MRFKIECKLLTALISIGSLSHCASSGANHRNSRTGNDGAVATQPTSSSQSNSPTNATSGNKIGDPIIWLVGGWNSCAGTSTDSRPGPLGMNAFRHFGPMYGSLKQKRFPDLEFFASCLTPSIAKVNLVHSLFPSDIVPIDREMAISVVAKRAADKNAPIVIIGHSYGGWISMRAAQVKIDAPIKLLLTMDPISAVTCTADALAKIIDARLGIDPFATPMGCITSPTDITMQQHAAIRRNVQRWVNLWQMDTFNILHGTPISQAENEQIFQDETESINGHIAMGLNPEVWAKIQAYIETSFGP